MSIVTRARFALAAAVLGALALGTSTTVFADAVTMVELRPVQGKLLDLLRREVATAAQQGKAPVVELTAAWCSHCKALNASLGNPLMQNAFAGVYLIQLDVESWADQFGSVGLELRGIPAFFPLDAQAHATGAQIDGGAWDADVPHNMAPPLKSFFRQHGAKAG